MLYYRFWLLALALIFSALVVRPVHAVVEQVNPTTNQTFYSYENSAEVAISTGHVYSTKNEACDAAYAGVAVADGNNLCRDSTTWAPIGSGSIYANTFTGLIGCPSATPSYSYNPITQKCEREAVVTCPVNGTVFNNGYYDVGTDPNINNGFPSPLIACNNNCQVAYNGGNISQRSLVAGVYHYFSQGGYYYTSQSCTSGSGAPSAVASVPAHNCASGQTLVSGSNGYAKCYNISTGLAIESNSASAVQSATTIATANASSAIQSATTLAQSAGLDASAVQQAGAVAAGVTASGGTGGSQQTKEPVMDEFCKNNPSSQICAEQDFGTVEATDMGTKNISVAITPVTVGSAGVCPAPTAITIHGQTKYMEWTTYCNYATGVKPILLAFAWLSAATMLIAGFRTA